MQPKEQPQLSPKEAWPVGLAKYEDVRAGEKQTLKKLGNKLGDVVRDVDTASKMAADKFDGDSALLRTARGFVTTGVGVGLEKSMNFVWDKVWQGNIPFYDKSKFGEGMAEAMNKFARSSDFNARMYYLIKEGTQDLSLAIFYNFLAFRSQPLLPKAEPKHLLRSLGADVVEAFVTPLSPHLPAQMKRESQVSSNNLLTEQINTLQDKLAQHASRSYYDKKNDMQVFPLGELMEKEKREIAKLTKQIGKVGKPVGMSRPERFLQQVIDVSNPVTQLGIDMIGTGVAELIQNFKAVRKIRSEKGGMEGKKVTMPRAENRWQQHDSRKYQDKKPWEKKEYNKDKVYYGKSKWEEQKRQEEYDLKADDT